jgi:hypothetical protein
MHREKLVLPYLPPRQYSLRQAYQGRVWRTPWSVIAREFFFWALGLALLGLAMAHTTITIWGGVTAAFLAGSSILASVLNNRTRVALIQQGVGAKAVLERVRRIPLLHEVFRGTRESTYRLTYVFEIHDGSEEKGSIWICGCARKYLPIGSTEMIAYNPREPNQNIPLRIAVMVAPH